MRFSFFACFVSLPLVLSSPGGAQPPARPTASKAAPSQQVAARAAFARFLTLNNQGQLKSASAKSLLTGEATRFAQTESLGPTSAPDGFALADSQHAVARV